MTGVPRRVPARLRGLGGRLGGRLAAGAAPYRRWWDGAEGRDRAVGVVAAVAGVAVLGAFLFGAWHVIGGGVIRGNWRAGAFGIGLAAVTGALLVLGYRQLSVRVRR